MGSASTSAPHSKQHPVQTLRPIRKSLADLDNLPEQDELADEIIENLESGLARFREIVTALER